MRFLSAVAMLMMVVPSMAVVGCQAGQGGESEAWMSLSRSAEAGEPVAELWVKGFACPFCATKLDTQLMKIQGVEEVAIDLGTGRTLVLFDAAASAERESLAGAVKEAGFTLDRIQMP